MTKSFLIILACLVLPFAACADTDLSDMFFIELLELNERLSVEIARRGEIPIVHVASAESDWIVTNTGTSDNPCYFKLGEMMTPEGYTLDPDFHATNDAWNQTFYYTADSDLESVKSIYVSGVANKSAKTMLDTVTSYDVYLSSDHATGKLGDHEIYCAYFVYGDTDTVTDTNNDGEVEFVNGYPSLCIYVDSIENSCVLMLLNGHMTCLDNVATSKTLLTKAAELLPLLTVEK